MNRKWIFVPVLSLSMVVCGWSDAQGRTSTPGRGMRIDGSKHAVNSAGGLRVSSGRSGTDARRPSGVSSVNVNRNRGNGGNAPRGGYSGGYSGLNNSDLGGLLEQYLGNGYRGGYHFDPYEGEKAQAKAYRDAAIANAIVNVVGILATAHQPQAVAVCPAPAPPQGHVERQRVIVQEGRTEEYQVWIPEYTIPETGEVVVGHNETRRRSIAPVYEDREIWVPTP